jgi:hypothetical protein
MQQSLGDYVRGTMTLDERAELARLKRERPDLATPIGGKGPTTEESRASMGLTNRYKNSEVGKSHFGFSTSRSNIPLQLRDPYEWEILRQRKKRELEAFDAKDIALQQADKGAAYVLKEQNKPAQSNPSLQTGRPDYDRARKPKRGLAALRSV